MQTHDWEALLAGTTEGPWEATDEHDDMGITGPDGLTLIDVNEGWSRCTRADLALAARAPAAVAEVIRLRKAIAELEAEERATADDEFFPVHLRDLCRAFADDLARILEGDNHE